MKKRKTLISAVLCATMVFSAGLSVGCKKEGETGGSSPKEERAVVLENFETDDYVFYVNREETQLSYEGGFIASENAKEYLPDGRALEIDIRKFISESWAGYAEDTGLCAITTFDMHSAPKNNGDWGFEWKYLSQLSVDAYNPNEFPVRISIYNLTRNGYPINFGTATLEAGEAGSVVANVNRYYMQNEFADKISYVLVAVNYDKTVKANGDLYYPEAKIYLDNLTAKVNENPVTAENGAAIIGKTFASENEILNFDDAGDINYIRETGGNYVKDADNEWSTRYWYCGTGSSYYYNSNPRYVYSGNKGSVEWRITPVLQPNMVTVAYDWNTRFSYTDGERLTGLTLEGDYLNYLNFARLQGGNVKIRMDVYNAASYDKDVFFGIHDTRGVATEIKTEFPYMYGNKGMTDNCFRLKAGEWNTVEISDFSHLDLSQGLARLRIMTTLSDVDEEISIYLNNLRFVEGEDERIVADSVNTADALAVRAPKIYTSYNYKVVKTGEEVKMPETTFSEEVTAKYMLDGEEVSAGHTFTPTQTGTKTLKITACNAAGKTSVKTVTYTVTDKAADLYKLYALDDINGLEYHAGKSAMGLNNLRLKYVNTDALQEDVFGNVITPIDGETSYTYITNYKTNGRIVLTNPLYRNIDEKFESLYFWFYNGGEASVTVSFNNYSVTVAPGSGWNKIVIDDFTQITSLGKAANSTSVIDASDMVGSYIKINSSLPYEKYAVSAIYGTPKGGTEV